MTNTIGKWKVLHHTCYSCPFPASHSWFHAFLPIVSTSASSCRSFWRPQSLCLYYFFRSARGQPNLDPFPSPFSSSLIELVSLSGSCSNFPPLSLYLSLSLSIGLVACLAPSSSLSTILPLLLFLHPLLFFVLFASPKRFKASMLQKADVRPTLLSCSTAESSLNKSS